MNAVVSELLNNFDCTLIVIINLITFFVIKLIDEFNGVKTVDMEKLLSNCEYVFNKYNEALHKYDEE